MWDAKLFVERQAELDALAVNIIESCPVLPRHTFGVEYQTPEVWGGEAIYPAELTAGYWILGD